MSLSHRSAGDRVVRGQKLHAEGPGVAGKARDSPLRGQGGWWTWGPGLGGSAHTSAESGLEGRLGVGRMAV